ncbi:MAG: hypothetical protein PHW01_01990 [Patescibacteria group bacterium]|nr:hypothetical protein [Patescibacteria group bacterium]
MKNLVLICIAMGSLILLLVIGVLVLPISVMLSATPFQREILRISCIICAIVALFCEIWVWLNIRKQDKFKEKQDLEKEQIRRARFRKQMEIIEQAQNVPLSKTVECCDLDKMIKEIVNSPNKIDSLIAKVRVLCSQFKFDKIPELFERANLTKEEKLELDKKLRAMGF